MPLPLILAGIQGASEATNKRNQAETGIIANAFNVLRGGLASKDLTPFQNNNSGKIIASGLLGNSLNQEKANQQQAQIGALGKLLPEGSNLNGSDAFALLQGGLFGG